MKKLFKQIVGSFKAWSARRRYARCVKQAAQILARNKANFSANFPGCEGALMTASWPPVSGTTPGFVVKGKTTIQWGTDGLLSSPYPSGGGFYTVTKFNQKPILDRTKLPNGTGITSSDIMLTDGQTWEITVRDDSTMTPPAINATISLVDALSINGSSGQVWTARVVDHNYDTAAKQAGERVLICDNLILIDSQTTAAQTAR